MSYTDEQLAIINHNEGNALINAVAGSGKTTVMVGLINRLAKDGIDPKKIMVLMFNKKAREDFQERLRLKFEENETQYEKDRSAQVRTLSSLAYRTISLLQSSGVIPEYDMTFSNSKVQNALARDALKVCDVVATSKNVDYLNEVSEWIKSRYDEEVQYMGETECVEVKLFRTYEVLRHKRQIRFATDWAYDSVSVVKKNPDLLHDVLYTQFKYLIVDEFQDINDCQMEIINIFVGDDTKLLVVGDVNQSIYAWRGSNPDIMLKSFPERYNPTTYNLSKTFRFGSKLSKAANNLISHNESRFEFECLSAEGTPETKVHVLEHQNYKPHELVKSLAKGKDYSDIVVLGRERSNWFETELNLLKHKIPYQVISNDEKCVLDTITIKTILGYLRLASNAKGFHPKSLNIRKNLISEMFRFPSLYLDNDYKRQLINRLAENPSSYQIFPDIKRQMKQHLKVDDKKLKSYCSVIDSREEIWDVCLGLSAEKSSAYRALRLIYSCKELSYKWNIERTSLREKDADYKFMLINMLIDLADSVKDTHPSIGEFLSYIDGLHKSYNEQTTEARQKCLTITTMHRAKGLEWSHVILPDLFDKSMPVVDEKGNVVDEEGDRRLLYVAMTRAKENVYLIGGMSSSNNSRFLDELLDDT